MRDDAGEHSTVGTVFCVHSTHTAQGLFRCLQPSLQYRSLGDDGVVPVERATVPFKGTIGTPWSKSTGVVKLNTVRVTYSLR